MQEISLRDISCTINKKARIEIFDFVMHAFVLFI